MYNRDINKISSVTKRKYKQSKPSGKGYYESYQHTSPPVCLCVRVHQLRIVYQSYYALVKRK